MLTAAQKETVRKAMLAEEKARRALHGLADYLEGGRESDTSLREFLAICARDVSEGLLLAMRAVNALRDDSTA